MAFAIYRYVIISKFITFIICQVGYVKRQDPLKCAYFDHPQAAVILIKGLLSKYAKLII